MRVYAEQPGAQPYSIPDSVPNPAVREMPDRREVPRRKEEVPTDMPEKVPA